MFGKKLKNKKVCVECREKFEYLHAHGKCNRCYGKEYSNNYRKKIKKNNIFDPVEEQFLVVINYINILNYKNHSDPLEEIVLLLELMKNTCRQCELYLNYELVQQGKLEKRN